MRYYLSVPLNAVYYTDAKGQRVYVGQIFPSDTHRDMGRITRLVEEKSRRFAQQGCQVSVDWGRQYQ